MEKTFRQRNQPRGPQHKTVHYHVLHAVLEKRYREVEDVDD